MGLAAHGARTRTRSSRASSRSSCSSRSSSSRSSSSLSSFRVCHAHKCRDQSHEHELTCKCREHERWLQWPAGAMRATRATRCGRRARAACAQRACQACTVRRALAQGAEQKEGTQARQWLSVCARFSVCTRFSVRNPLKARFLQIGKVWSHFGKISKRKALGHSGKGCRTCHRRAHRSRGSCCSSSSSGARWMQLGGARSRTHERGTPARLCDRSARLSYTALTARGGILKNLGEK